MMFEASKECYVREKLQAQLGEKKLEREFFIKVILKVNKDTMKENKRAKFILLLLTFKIILLFWLLFLLHPFSFCYSILAKY